MPQSNRPHSDDVAKYVAANEHRRGAFDATGRGEVEPLRVAAALLAVAQVLEVEGHAVDTDGYRVVTTPAYNRPMTATASGDAPPAWREHPQGLASIGGRSVWVDAEMVELLEALSLRGIVTVFSCQDVQPPTPGGSWRDDPDKTRCYVVFPDVEELRKLVPYLDRSTEVLLGAYRHGGVPRWEYGLSLHGGPGALPHDVGDLRLQVSVFIPAEQVPALISCLIAGPV